MLVIFLKILVNFSKILRKKKLLNFLIFFLQKTQLFSQNFQFIFAQILKIFKTFSANPILLSIWAKNGKWYHILAGVYILQKSVPHLDGRFGDIFQQFFVYLL